MKFCLNHAAASMIVSPSVWRVWIEMILMQLPKRRKKQSPSVWRVWIEIIPRAAGIGSSFVTLRVEGVD